MIHKSSNKSILFIEDLTTKYYLLTKQGTKENYKIILQYPTSVPSLLKT